ncbi:MAG: hypothetical protein ACUVTO_06640 [Candidatus Caldatribacteriaceae bacterium]
MEGFLEESKAGVCLTWEEAKVHFPVVQGDERIVKEIWEKIEYWPWLFIWHVLLSF